MTPMPEKQSPPDYGSELVRGAVPGHAEGSIDPDRMLAVEAEGDDRLSGPIVWGQSQL